MAKAGGGRQPGDADFERDDQSLVPLIDLIDWDKVVAEGVITSDEIDAELLAKGLDRHEYDHLYESPRPIVE